MILKLLRYKILMAFMVLLFASGQTTFAASGYRYKQIESKADKAFVRGDYQKAMKLYEHADEKTQEGTADKFRLELKMARLYTLLQQPDDAIRFYDAVHLGADTLLSVNDVCFFIDALRQSGQSQRAEVVARSYAFKSPYSRNQRYLNTLQALSNEQYYYAKGDSDFKVALLDKSGPFPEFWLGTWQGKTFYAISHSPIQDPLKIYYHRTQYFAMNDLDAMTPFRSIPRELQSGQVTFSEDGNMMIATGILYKGKDQIFDPGQEGGMFVTQLYYSIIDKKSGGWSRFQPLFPFQEQFNLAHPNFFNDGKSLIFSSDRPGTYGGMDLFICHWDEVAAKWSDPTNLGAAINTEGNEINPLIIDDALFFASNGLEGYGGYDLYRVSFGGNMVLPGSLFHYPYPLNSTYNDFQINFDATSGYFISDRRGHQWKDDIYTFDRTVSSLSSEGSIGVSDEYTAMMGNLNLIKGMAAKTEVFEKELLVTATYAVPEQGEILASVFFDFNSSKLSTEAMAQLDLLLSDPGIADLHMLEVAGYADEFGTTPYNKRLSEQRAQAVAKYLTKGGIKPQLTVEGRGKLTLSQQEMDDAYQRLMFKPNDFSQSEIKNNTLPMTDRIQITQKARRVDVIVKK